MPAGCVSSTLQQRRTAEVIFSRGSDLWNGKLPMEFGRWPLLMSMRKPSADGHDSTGFRVNFDFTSVHRHYLVKA